MTYGFILLKTYLFRKITNVHVKNIEPTFYEIYENIKI